MYKKILTVYWDNKMGDTKFTWVRKDFFGLERVDITNDLIYEVTKILNPDKFADDYKKMAKAIKKDRLAKERKGK